MYTEIVALTNVTFSADKRLIEKARARARAERTTLNVAFREWIERYAGSPPSGEEFARIMKSLSHVRAGRKFTRDEMNERAATR